MLDLDLDASCISGSKFTVNYDNIATQTLGLVAGTAEIKDSQGLIGTCVVDATTFYIECVLSGTPDSLLYILLTNFPNPTCAISSTDEMYEVIGINAASTAF